MVLRPKPEKVEERERTRLSLLAATVKLAARHGFAGLGLREVARAAEIAPTSFYRHFADMEELGLALTAELIGPLLAHWKQQVELPTRSPREATARLIEQALESVHEEPELMRFLLAERVGAVATCRAVLRRKLTELAIALQVQLVAPTHSPPRHSEHEAEVLAGAAVALLLEGCGRALELDAADSDASQALRRDLELQLDRLLAHEVHPHE